MKHPLTKRPRGFSLVELITAFFVLTILLALIAPAMQQARSDARRDQCKNNLKQIGIAMHNYHDVHNCMPPAWTNHTPHAGDKARYGWSMALAPFLDQIAVYDQADFSNQNPRAYKATQSALAIYRCPSDTTEALNPLRGKYGTSNYSANFGTTAPPRWLGSGMSANWPGQAPTLLMTDGMCWYNSCCRFRDVTDGTSYTLLVGERSIASGAGIWMGVRGNNYESDLTTDTSAGNEINSGETSFSSNHTGGAVFLFGDGRVQFINEKISTGSGQQLGTFQKLGSRHDNQVVGEF